MKLVMAVVQAMDVRKVLNALMEAGYRATRISSTGGFLVRGNSTILIGVEDDRVDALMQVLRAQAHGRREFVSPVVSVSGSTGVAEAKRLVQVDVGGPTVMVLDVGRFEQLTSTKTQES
jgi:uncharacterized protein YaaQ